MRRFIAQQEPQPEEQSAWMQRPLDVSRATAVLIRQSKVGAEELYRQSREAQLDLIQYGMQMRKETTDENLWLYDEGGGISGQKRFDQRPELSRLVQDIIAGNIGSIIVYAEDRLFRHRYLDQVTEFLKVCEPQKIQLFVPPYGYYDFSRYADPIRFIQKMIESYGYIENQIYGKLIRGLERKASAGLWNGRNIPRGFVISKKVKPYEQKYILYERHLEPLNGLFKRCIELDFNLHRLAEEVERMDYVFPDFLPNDFISYETRSNMTKVPVWHKSGICALQSTLTNVAYLGHWVHHNKIVVYHNHPAAICEGLFWPCYNALAPTLPNGEDNTNRRHYGARTEYKKAQALLGSVLHYESVPESKCYVGEPNYDFVTQKTKTKLEYHFSIHYLQLDRILVDRLMEVADSDPNIGENVRRRLATAQIEAEQLAFGVEETLEKTLRRIKKIQANLNDPDIELDAQSKSDFNLELKQLRQAQKNLEQKKNGHPIYSPIVAEEYVQMLNEVQVKWGEMTHFQRVQGLKLIIDRIDIKPLSNHIIQMIVYWVGPEGILRPDLAYIWRRQGEGRDWSPEEFDQIRLLYPTADIDVVRQAISTRTWTTIKVQASELKIRRLCKTSTSVIPKDMSFDDYKAIEPGLRDLLYENRAGAQLPVLWPFPASLNPAEDIPTI